MELNQKKYKLFKSFRVNVLPEDKVVAKLQMKSIELVNVSVVIEDLNFEFISFSTSEKLPSDEVELEMSKPSKFFGQNKINVFGNIILSRKNNSEGRHLYQYSLYVPKNDDYIHWIHSFVENFSKKRLNSYLLASSTRTRILDFDEMSETTALMLNTFKDMTNDLDDLKISDYLHTSLTRIDAKKGRIWLIDVSTNQLVCEFSTSQDEVELKIDYRKGVPGKVLSNPEVLNLYRPILEDSNSFEKVESSLAVPLYNRFHKVIGVLEFVDKTTEKRFSVNDESFANLLSIFFSSHFQFFNPVNSLSKMKKFYPGLKSNFLNLLDINKDKNTLHLIQKVKNNKENVVINHHSKEALEIVVNEMVVSSHFHDWEVVHFENSGSFDDLKNLNQTIIIIDDAHNLDSNAQEKLVELIDENSTWVISLCAKDIIQREKFLPKFWTKFAKHHLNLQKAEVAKDPRSSFIELANSLKEIPTFNEKVEILTKEIGLPTPHEIKKVV
ncbi:MAG: GAF domain-containing protein [Bacteriovoracaceae bacterium]|nr:GAF domain-containing protein [Bacteriovoracaceae bacterium]